MSRDCIQPKIRLKICNIFFAFYVGFAEEKKGPKREESADFRQYTN